MAKNLILAISFGFKLNSNLNKIILFCSNSTVSSVEILQMLRSIEFPLRFIRLDDHKLGIFGIF